MKAYNITSAVDGKQYQVSEHGTYYHAETDTKVIEVLEKCRLSNKRIRFFLGDTKTGEVWPEIFDVTGYVSRSMGPIKIPLLKNTKNSIDGGGILAHCILKIRETTGNVLYAAPNIKEPVIEIKGNDKDGYQVEYNNKVVFNCGSRKLAEKEKSRLM